MRGAGYFLGTTETIFGALILLDYWSPRLGILGALGSIVTYVGTTTIIPFLPDAWANEAGGFPIMTLPLGFLTKDVLFLVVSFYLLRQDLTRAAKDIAGDDPLTSLPGTEDNRVPLQLSDPWASAANARPASAT